MNYNKLFKRLVLIGLALSIAILPLATGCGTSEENGGIVIVPEGNEVPLKVGFSICYTGVAASKGKPMGDAKLDVIKYINDELGGIYGRPIEVVWYDNQYDAAKAATIINKLMDDGALLFTTNSSKMMAASMEIANRAEFPGFAVFSSPVVTHPPKHIYAQMPDYGDDWAAFAKYYMDNIWQGEGKPKMALHLLNNPTGSGAENASRALADELGIEIVATEEHTATTVSEIESLTRIRALNPDVLFISSTPDPTAIIIKDAVDLGMYPDTGMTIGCAHASFTIKLVELAGADAEGARRRGAQEGEGRPRLPEDTARQG